jgi:predicted dehydrogenase
MPSKNINIGMVGYGFMGRAHSNAWRKVSNFFDTGYRPVLKAVAARNREKAQAFADQWGYESVETDWRRLVERDDIDAIDICTPNDTHAEIAIAAADAGKMILCEKPIARNARSAADGRCRERAGVPNTSGTITGASRPSP